MGVVCVTDYDGLFGETVRARRAVGPGDRVLVVGASGGTGLVACQPRSDAAAPERAQ